jgi:hypothetical protein
MKTDIFRTKLYPIWKVTSESLNTTIAEIMDGIMIFFWKQIFICWENFYKFTHLLTYFFPNLSLVLPEVRKSICPVIKQVIFCFAGGPYIPTQHTDPSGTVINDNYEEKS